jgi:hypothetical protein
MRVGVALLSSALVLSGPLFGAAHLRGDITLSQVAPSQEGKPKLSWVQIACTGKWMGHPDHPNGVEFTRQLFDEVIRNFRANPSYVAGADGLGTAPVIPFDYEHASEMAPTEGSIPQQGAPAPAWAYDLQVRASADGTSDELWSLTEFGKTAREQVANKEYLWTSVSIWKSARDASTGKPIGAVLTSVALTNKPFIKGMEPLAIAASARGRIHAGVSVYGTAESPEQAVVGIREIFGLPADASVEAIVQQFERLRVVLATAPGDDDGEAARLYEEGEFIARRLRELLGLPALATLDEVIAAGGQILAALSLVQPSAPAAAPGEPSMNASTTSPALLGKLTTLYSLREGSNDQVIFAAAEKAVEAQGALAKLQALFGSDDAQALLVDAQKAIEEAKKTEGLVAALSEAQKTIAGFDTEKAEGEVEQVAASLGLSAEQSARMKPLLLAERTAIAADPVKLAAWREKNLPKPGTTLLTQTLVAGPNGAQYVGPHTGLPQQQPVHFSAPGAGGPPAIQQHPLETYPGRNTCEKAMAFLCDKRPGFKQLQRIDQVKQAGTYISQRAPLDASGAPVLILQ